MCTITFLSALSPWRWHSIRTVTDCDWVPVTSQSHRPQSVPTWATAAVACFHGKFAANWCAKFVHCLVHWWWLLYESVRSTYQTSERWSDVNAKSQGMYAIFDLTRRYGNENGNGRSAASGTLGKFCANKRQGLTFCVTVDANWLVCRPKQIRLLVEHFENKL